jgi:hypothetical protein
MLTLAIANATSVIAAAPSGTMLQRQPRFDETPTEPGAASIAEVEGGGDIEKTMHAPAGLR